MSAASRVFIPPALLVLSLSSGMATGLAVAQDCQSYSEYTHLLGSHPCNQWARAMAISGQYAFIASATCQTGHSLEIFDISNPQNLQRVGSTCGVADPHGAAVSDDYLYLVSEYASMGIYDISNIASPVELSYTHIGSSGRGVAVSGQLAYVAADIGGVKVFDVSDPYDPQEIGSFNTQGSSYAVALDDGLAYVADYDGGLLVLDISAPTSPSQVAVVPMQGSGTNAEYVVVADGKAYIACGVAGFQIFDVAAPSSPQYLGGFNDPSFTATHLAVDGPYLHVANYHGLQIFDVSTPTAPSVVSSQSTIMEPRQVFLWGDSACVLTNYGLNVFDVQNPQQPHFPGIVPSLFPWDIAVSGDYAFIAKNAEGLGVIDISDPEAPLEVAEVSLAGYVVDVHVDGVYAYVSARSGGMHVVDISDPLAPTQIGNLPAIREVYSVVTAENYAYVGDEYTGYTREKLRAVDISDPTLPVEVGVLSLGTNDDLRSMVRRGSTLYVAIGSGGVAVIDVSIPSAPQHVGDIQLRSASGVCADGGYLYVAGEFFGDTFVAPTLFVIDVRVPHVYDIVGEIRLPETSRVAVDDDVAYVTGNSLFVVDVSQKDDPCIIGSASQASPWVLALDNQNVYLGGDGFIVASRQCVTAATGCALSGGVLDFMPGPGSAAANAEEALGAPDGVGVSLGYTGSVEFVLAQDAVDDPGIDLCIYEQTSDTGSDLPEGFIVNGSDDGVTWYYLGEGTGPVLNIDLAATSLAAVRYLQIIDTPPMEQNQMTEFDPSTIGADIDAVVLLNCALHESSCVDGNDNDGDGYTDCADSDCLPDADGDGAAAAPCGGDCDDYNGLIQPGAVEICGNGVDDDCDGQEDCDDDDCLTVDSDGDGTPDCDDDCPLPDTRCQWFTWQTGGTAVPSEKFDIAIVADVTFGAADWEADLGAEIDAVAFAMSQMPVLSTHTDSYSFWRGTRRVERETITLSGGREVEVYEDLMRAAWHYGIDALVVRGDFAADVTQIYTGNGVIPIAYIATDPEIDVIPILHELGHAAFGLADEYNTSFFSGCSGTPCENRVTILRDNDPPANVWSSEDDCEDAGYSTSCYKFCTYDLIRGTWRLGDEENPNLMRAYCEDHGVPQVDGYGEAGNARLSALLSSSGLKGRESKAIHSFERSVVLHWHVASGVAVTDSVSIDRIPPPDLAPASTALIVELLNHAEETVGYLPVWDPRFITVHDSIMVEDTVPLSVAIPLGPEGHRWRLLGNNGEVLVQGSIGAEFLDYCRRYNFTDVDCLGTDSDADSIPDVFDNCPLEANPDQIDVDGNGYGDVCEPVGVLETRPTVSGAIRLVAVHPNPFNPATTFEFELHRPGQARLDIYTVRGEKVAMVFNRQFSAGRHSIRWPGRDDHGRTIGAGVYIARLESNGEVKTLKMMILK